MPPISMRFGGYQAPISVHSRASVILKQEIEARLGDAVDIEIDGNIVARGHKASELLTRVEGGELTTAILDSGAIYEDHRLVPVRYSIAQQSCSWFSFEIETTDDLIFIGYELEYATKGTRVVMGKRA